MKFAEIALDNYDTVAHKLVAAKLVEIEEELQKIEADPRYFRLGKVPAEIVGRIRAVLERMTD